MNVIPRTMIESKGGESIKGMTIADPRLVELGRSVAEGLRLVGPATVQCFDEPEGLPVTDINCRFGGAFPLPLAAGRAIPSWCCGSPAASTSSRRWAGSPPG